MSEWISVKDKFPREMVTVLLLCDCNGRVKIFSGYCENGLFCLYLPELKFLEGSGGIDFPANIWEIRKTDKNNTITHWMPIPEMPNE